MLLAIDTSTRYAGVALVNDEGQLVQLLHWRSPQNHTVELMPAIELVLSRGQTTLWDLAGIAVALGPGSFSALRVGVGLAKGLAWSTGVPLVTATSLETEAFGYRATGATVCAVLDAVRSQVAWALFDDTNGRLRQTTTEQISDPAEISASLPTPVLVCGEGLERHADAILSAVGHEVRLALPYLPAQRVAALGFLGMERLQAGAVADTRTTQPLYVRRPTIAERGQRPASTPPSQGQPT